MEKKVSKQRKRCERPLLEKQNYFQMSTVQNRESL